jgi:hypothetical protein
VHGEAAWLALGRRSTLGLDTGGLTHQLCCVVPKIVIPTTTAVNRATISHPCQVRGPQPTPTLFRPNHGSYFAKAPTSAPRLSMDCLGALRDGLGNRLRILVGPEVSARPKRGPGTVRGDKLFGQRGRQFIWHPAKNTVFMATKCAVVHMDRSG